MQSEKRKQAILCIILIALAIADLCVLLSQTGAPDTEHTKTEIPYTARNLNAEYARDTNAAAVKAQLLTTPECDENPYEGIALTEAEKEKLAKMAFGEARGESFEGQTAVVLVALNRYLHPSFPGSISEILDEENQFYLSDTFTKTQMDAVETALAGSPVLGLNTDVVFFSTGSLTCGSYYKTIGGHIFRTYA